MTTESSGTMRLRSQDSTLTFTLRPSNGNIRLSATHITSTPEETQRDLSRRIATIANLPLDRLRVTFETSNRALDKRIHLDSPPKVEDIPDEGTVLIIKDLGPQLSWRLVFIIEYIGPILLHPMFYYCQKLFYGRSFDHSLVQRVTLAMVVLHFLKREFETLFIHRFSADTMPLLYLFRNSGHYWALAGIVFGYIMYHPSFSHSQRTSTQLVLAITAYAYAELSNLYTHISLRRLRPEGSRVRQIPKGYGFDWPFGGISCANYFFEIMAWVVIGLWSGCWAIVPFLAVAFFMMDLWAQGKQRKYRKEFPNYPKRAAIFPFIR